MKEENSIVNKLNLEPNPLHICESDGLQYLSYPPQWKCKICGKFYYISSTDRTNLLTNSPN